MDRDKRFGRFVRAMRKKVCKLSLRDAAQKIGISPPYLSRIEAGREHPPSVKILERMSEVYKISLQKIIDRASIREIEECGERMERSPALSVFFKVVKDLPEEKIVEVIRQVCKDKGWDENEFINEIQRRKKKFPRLHNGDDGLFAADVPPRFLSKKQIAEMAYRLLRRHNLGEGQYVPPTDIEVLAEMERGIRLFYDEDMRVFRNGEPIELGRSHWSPDEDNIREIHINNALAEGEFSSVRRLRFTLGHELFHCVEHLILMDEKERLVNGFSRLLAEMEVRSSSKKKKGPSPYIEKWFKKPDRASKLLTDEDWREWQADYFSACLLMPEWSVREEFSRRFGDGEIAVAESGELRKTAYEIAGERIGSRGVFEHSLKEVYDVSAQAMAIRLMQLNLVRG